MEAVSKLLTHSGHRREVLARRQQDEQDQLRREQRAQEKLVTDRLLTEQTQQIDTNKAAYVRNAAAMKRRQRDSRDLIQREIQELTKERSEVLRDFRLHEKPINQQRIREKPARSKPQEPEPINLTKLANEAFAFDPEGDSDHRDSESPEATAKPKRTRKRKHPSERTNRRMSRQEHSDPIKPETTDLSDQQANRWEEEPTPKPGHRKERHVEREDAHER